MFQFFRNVLSAYLSSIRFHLEFGSIIRASYRSSYVRTIGDTRHEFLWLYGLFCAIITRIFCRSSTSCPRRKGLCFQQSNRLSSSLLRSIVRYTIRLYFNFSCQLFNSSFQSFLKSEFYFAVVDNSSTFLHIDKVTFTDNRESHGTTVSWKNRRISYSNSRALTKSRQKVPSE